MSVQSSDDRVAGARSKWLDRLRRVLVTRHYSGQTVRGYAMWINEFIVFRGERHPAEVGELKNKAFLTQGALKERVAAFTRNRACSALLAGKSEAK
ncbi:MAG: phage integrase N-terminal SAM-like domain-containing protein [Candidatus Binatia bacterium]|nr:phage integrase N-terminal SAM-like domain-containing protein [Candidatus Binatia bacterium]